MLCVVLETGSDIAIIKLMNHQLITKPSIAWVLLSTNKVKNIGQEPYVFVPSSTPGVVIDCLAEWDDGSDTDDVMEFSTENKLDFIRTFNDLYPEGAIASTPSKRNFHSLS